jgi:pilus assembly protein CpaF
MRRPGEGTPPPGTGPAGRRAAGPSLEHAVHRALVDLPVETLDRGARWRLVADLIRQRDPLVSGQELPELVERVLARLEGLGPLEALLTDPAITEIMANGPGAVWVERCGRIEQTDVTLDAATLDHLVERIVTPLGRRVDRSSPLLDARLADGSRVNVVIPPLALDGTCLTIRRFGTTPVPLGAAASPGVAALLTWAVRARYNMVISGGTGTGKTTLLNCLGALIPPHERIITIEDAAELQLALPHVVRLEARPPSADGVGAVSIRDLLRNSLRMRPDRIVVGEVRGAEALDMLQAMNTGHEGSLSTCHANGPADALLRLETMVLHSTVDLPLAAVREQLASALDLVIQVARIGPVRRVVAVAEVLDHADRVRPLAGTDGLHSLPRRRSRHPGAPAPDPAWLEVDQ